jgi:hypothetical protein
VALRPLLAKGLPFRRCQAPRDHTLQWPVLHYKDFACRAGDLRPCRHVCDRNGVRTDTHKSGFSVLPSQSRDQLN